MVSVFRRSREVLSEEGLATLIRKSAIWTPRLCRARYRSFVWRFTSRNWLVGKWIELRGNRARSHGLIFDLDNPHVSTSLKSRFVFGTWEVTASRLLGKFLPRGLPVIEFGACIGGVSCLVNRRLHEPGRHMVVEAHPGLMPTLTENRNLNQCEFEIIHAALAYDSETVEFGIDPTMCIGGSTTPDSGSVRVTVPTVSLESLIDRSGFETITLIVDVEGSEVELVKRELPLLRERVHTLFVEGHPWIVGPEAVDAMLTSLQHAGFQILQREGEDYVLRNVALSHRSAHSPAFEGCPSPEWNGTGRQLTPATHRTAII